MVLGRVDGEDLTDVAAIPLAVTDEVDGAAEGAHRFEGSHRIEGSGRFAHGLRVRARHHEAAGGPLKDLVFWV
jgi:hypothetical protein